MKTVSRKNGERDASGKRHRNANGSGSLSQKDSGLFMARWAIGRKQIGEESVIGKDGIITVKPKYKYLYHCESTGCYEIEAAREYLKNRTADLALNREISTIDRILEKKDALLFSLSKIEEQKKADEIASEAQKPAISLIEAFGYYQKSSKRPNSGKRTLDGYEGQYGKFVDWMTENHPDIKEIRGVTPQMAEEFATYLKSKRSTNTHNKYMVFLRTMWKTLSWDESAKITVNPWDGIRNLVVDDCTKKENFTVEQLERIIPLLPADYKILWAISLYTGLRLADCALLSWNNVEMTQGFMDVEPLKTKRKYHRHTIIPIHPVLYAIFNNIPKDCRIGYVLPKIAEKYKKEPSLITNFNQKIIRKAGLETSVKTDSDKRSKAVYGFHSIRHSTASFLYNAHVAEATISKILAHHRISMTFHYYHENLTVLQEAIATLPVIRSFGIDYTPQSNPLLHNSHFSPATGSSANANPLLLVSMLMHSLSSNDLEQVKNALMQSKPFTPQLQFSHPSPLGMA